MPQRSPYRRCIITLTALVAGLAWPAASAAQNVSGQASAVQATVTAPVGTSTTSLSNTGTISSVGDAREASQTTGAIGALLSGEALHATTISYADQVDSEASIANVALNVGDTTIGADFLMSRVMAVKGVDTGTAIIRGLTINGVPIAVTGAKNQSVALPGGVAVINEQLKSGGQLVVNALHVVIDGAADVVIASAAAKAQ